MLADQVVDPTTDVSPTSHTRGAEKRRPTDAEDHGRPHPDEPVPSCSIDAALEVIGDRWSILIVRDTFKGIRRFEEIQRDLGIPRAVLTDRLRSLVAAGVLARREYMERPPRYEYRLTEMGRELSPILVSLMHWGDRWMGDGEPPVQLVHRACGTPVSLDYYCWECATSFSATDIRSAANNDGGRS